VQRSSRTVRTPRARRLLLLLAVLALLAVPTAAVANHLFVDVGHGDTHEPGIEYLKDTGITLGCAVNPDRFCPGDSLTRAQMGTFLFRASGHDPNTPPSVNAASIADVEVVDDFNVINNSAVNTASASCPDGMKVTGGGSQAENPHDYTLIYSRPLNDGTGWVVQYGRSDGALAASHRIDVWATCIAVGP
jgi:hypothetical protein